MVNDASAVVRGEGGSKWLGHVRVVWWRRRRFGGEREFSRDGNDELNLTHGTFFFHVGVW